MARFRLLTAGLVTAIGAGSAGAVDLVIDYTYDTQGFFNPGTTNGALARATLEKAAADFSAILNDSFTPIVVPGDYVSDANGQAPPVLYTWDWNIEFSNPGVNGGPTVVINEPTFAADEFRIYAGGRALGGSTLGIAGPGGGSFSAGGSYYLQSELDEINAISAAFENQRSRGQGAGDFSRWGGVVSFDNDGTNWNYDWKEEPLAGQSDLYSVALHELAHTVGWGTADEWSDWITNGTFRGPVSTAEYGGWVPVDAGSGHWATGTMSTVFRDGDAQETSLDPSLTQGTRKLLTNLDVAALDDIGWDINPTFTYVNTVGPADLDGDGDVDDADFGQFFAAFSGPGVPTANPAADLDGDNDTDDADFGLAFAAFTGPGGVANVPEPASAAVVLAGAVALARRRRGAA